MRGHDGHVLIWLTAGLALMVIMGAVAFFMLQGNEKKEGAPLGVSPQESKKDESSQGQPVVEMPGGKEQGDEGKKGLPVEEGGPCGNERSLQADPYPPIESGEEAFALLVQMPEIRDWYWSVEQPRFQAWDQGDRFLIKLYALLPAEGSLPERQAVFGQYHVLKSSGETIRAD